MNRLAPLAALLFLSSAASAPRLRAEAGRTAADTLKRSIGARAAALGGAYVAVAEDVHSLGYNPAALATLKGPALAATYLRGFADDNFGFIGYAHPLSWVTLSLGAIYFDGGDIQLNFSGGASETRKAQQDTIGMAALSLPLPGGFALGALGKLFRLELAEEAHASGYAADAGVLWQTPLAGLNLGGSIQNLGPDVVFEQTGDPLPQTTRFGGAYLLDLQKLSLVEDTQLAFYQFLFTADGVRVQQERLSARTGLEMGMNLGETGHAALRVGYLFGRDVDSITIGMGLKEGRYVFDYAIGLMEKLEDVHRLSFGVRF
ncbi:MAG: PorV/PorQ family protein [Elusimicrobia bacterium]|nr:PorV/PorQ family protein [Elusimicrobiota bacterium]